MSVTIKSINFSCAMTSSRKACFMCIIKIKFNKTTIFLATKLLYDSRCSTHFQFFDKRKLRKKKNVIAGTKVYYKHVPSDKRVSYSNKAFVFSENSLLDS